MGIKLSEMCNVCSRFILLGTQLSGMLLIEPVGHPSIWNVHCSSSIQLGISLSEICIVCSRFILLGIQLSGMF